jgi:hypothetical protein
LDQLERLVEVTGSAIEPGVYLVNASQADKISHGAATPPRPLSPKIQEHPLQETTVGDEVVMTTTTMTTTSEQDAYTDPLGAINNHTGATSTGATTGPITVEGMRRRRSINGHKRDKSKDSNIQSSSPPKSTGPARSWTQTPLENQLDPLVNTVKEMRWTILERFSQVARLSRDAATNILDHPITKTILPPHVQQRIQDSEAAKKMMEDYDSARVYLAKWAATVADQGDRERRETHKMDHLYPASSNRHRSRGADGRRINDHEDEEGPLGAFNVLDVRHLSAYLVSSYHILSH